MKFKQKFLSSVIALGLVTSSMFISNANSQQLEVHHIDVGQGESIYIELPDGSDVLIDAGKSNYGSTVVNYLKGQEKDIDIDNISKDILSSNKLLPVIEAWNKLSLSKLVAIKPNTNRYKMLKARINEFGIEKVIEAVESINNSDFLKGQNDRSWVITFDWLIKPNNFTKVLEGNYLNKGGNMNGQHNNRKHSNRWGSGKNKTILNVNTESQYGELSDEDRRKAEELI